MKIGIDARMLGSKQGGIGRYIEEIVKTYQEICSEENWQFVIFLRQENWDLIKETPLIKKVLADIYWYGFKEQFCLKKIIQNEKVDLMHFPHWNIPFFYNKPFVVTIHDLLLLHFPSKKASTLGPIKYFFKNIAYKIILKKSLIKSKHIITPSEFTKNDIIKTFKISETKITAIHLAPLKTENNLITLKENNKNILQKYNIKKQYILYVGVAYPHKNLNNLISAWKIFSKKYPEYQLVLSGRKNYFYNEIEKFALKELENFSSVIFTDYVSDNDLEELYKNSSLYVFPSLYEGFGLPPLEAIQYNIPVISSNAGSLPEVLKSSALFFNPKNINEMVSALECGLNDEKIRQMLKNSGQQLIHNFSWKNTAKKTLEIYKKMV